MIVSLWAVAAAGYCASVVYIEHDRKYLYSTIIYKVYTNYISRDNIIIT